MRHFARVVMISAAVLLFAGLAAAQQKPKPAEPANRIIPLKVGIVLSEYDGAKKISSLPYTLAANTGPGPGTHLRLGVRLPIQTGQGQFQYQDVGTNIDCSARAMPNGAYKLDITVGRSSVYLAGTQKTGAGLQVKGQEPAVRQFSVSTTLILHNGQTDESTVATDPVDGHQVRVSATLHVVNSAS